MRLTKIIHPIGHALPWIALAGAIIMPVMEISQRYSYAGTLGTVSLILFVITLIPGILRRFKLTSSSGGKILTQMILPIRRQLGIAMFITAFAHSIGLRWETFQLAAETGVPPQPPLFEIFGTVSLLILLPLFITSNQQSVRILKRGWKNLHRLIYVAGWIIFGHVTLQGISWQAIVIGIVMVAEVGSLVNATVRK